MENILILFCVTITSWASFGCGYFLSLPLLRICSKSPIILRARRDTPLPSWMQREEEEVFDITPDSDPFTKKSTSLFDSILVESDDKSGEYSISKMSVADIAESYSFSPAYLGDFLIQMGCQPPIDVDLRLSKFLTGDQIYTLMEAINTLDPFETNEGYDSMCVGDLADELDLTASEMVRLCREENVNLPFGLRTVAHETVVRRIRELVDSEEHLEIIVDPAGAADTGDVEEVDVEITGEMLNRPRKENPLF